MLDFVYFLVLFTFTLNLDAQNPENKNIVEEFRSYTELPRELAYGHLNKTTLLNGEALGFTVYVFDKYLKTPSKVTKNLYCTLENENGLTIKKSMILVENGTASGSFEIDEMFPSGTYVFKAYTNWMKNFDEQNFYVQKINIINPDDYDSSNEPQINQKIDAQFLPEGGHLIADISNTIGVVIKNNLGFGIPELSGKVYNKEGAEQTNFKTNSAGIGKFTIIPRPKEIYNIVLDDSLKSSYRLMPAKEKGVNLALTDFGNRVALSIKTNPSTLPMITGKSFALSVHNGSQIKTTPVNFSGDLEVLRYFDYDYLFSGINVFTLFDDTGTPLLERLFFKYDGLDFIETETPSVVKSPDSLTIELSLKTEIDSLKLNNLSVSVLPFGTESYRPHQNLISQILLQPYLNGFVENISYYFQDIDAKKRFELDKLLLTQGWSSYDWNLIFKKQPDVKFRFENGIRFKANIQNSRAEQFMIFPMTNSAMTMVDVKEHQTQFNVDGLLPIDDEQLRIGALDRKKRLKKPGLYLQFFPSKIPTIKNYQKIFSPQRPEDFDLDAAEPLYRNLLFEGEQLGLVIINAKKENARLEELQSSYPNGDIDFFDENDRNRYVDFASYLNTKGFTFNQAGNSVQIINNRRTNFANSAPIIYLDDVLLNDYSSLINFDMRNIDYIVINKSGLGEGIRGSGGAIRIVTDPTIKFGNNAYNDISQKSFIPLTFTPEKQFYTPQYTYYRSEFFRKYGVIDWKPHLNVDSNGNVEFKVKDTTNEKLTLFIEGFANDGRLISEVKYIVVD